MEKHIKPLPRGIITEVAENNEKNVHFQGDQGRKNLKIYNFLIST